MSKGLEPKYMYLCIIIIIGHANETYSLEHIVIIPVIISFSCLILLVKICS